MKDNCVILSMEARKVNILEPYKQRLFELCAQHKVDQLYAFGSVLTDVFDKNEKSDIDFYLIMQEGLDPLQKGEFILQLWFELEQLFNRKIDLLTNTSITNTYLQKEIDRTKQLIYDRQIQKVSV